MDHYYVIEDETGNELLHFQANSEKTAKTHFKNLFKNKPNKKTLYLYKRIDEEISYYDDYGED